MNLPNYGRPFRHGQPVDAGILHRIREAARRLAVRVEWPLVLDPTSNTIYLDDYTPPAAVPAPLYIRITGAGVDPGKYPWVVLTPDPATGDLVPGTQSGTVDADPAFELNGNVSVPNPYNAEAWRDAQGVMRFRASQCP